MNNSQPTITRAANIHVTIDRIALRGIEPGDRRHLIAALQSELTRVLSDPETRTSLTHSGHIPVLRPVTLPYTPGPSGSRSLGRSIARAIGNRGVAPRGRIAP
jgi:hypothetical protein